ncbi:PAS domain-containing protein [Xanthomonas phaseoli pv. dieffenbachiae]|uniref:two-component system sensor histidine kinase NtrB n=1 Tax=Xanthomonas TaxID=338 RepID=UPI0006E53809|nr:MULTISPECIES: PAS domain-containing sensor histidine kinase [Xanthomonas]MBO9748307.1 PAS domain-containing protein [Xanthomonas phaseoli pv. dieffenbachiae]MBO9750620.1 PAS domain-containing protein [Xanthomonas phaseoli pv. dieffenbachiae]MBO9889331.1 PAS domain-containing protein [Xanthomonas sp. D-36-1]OQP75984.1 PAS domain-containing sensor histidine kinase [Xanthomonas citri]
MNHTLSSPDRYRQIVELSPDSIKEIDLDGRVRFVNSHGVARIAAENAERVLGQQWASLWPEEVRETVEEAISAASRGERRQFDAACTTPSGERRFWLVSTSPLTNVDGEIEAVLAVNRDVTERRQAEVALRTLNDSLSSQPELALVHAELAHAIDEKLGNANQRAQQLEGELNIARAAQRLAEAVAEQAQKGDAIGQLLAGMVHDFNNVLQAASGAVEMVLLSQGIDDKNRRLLGMAESALQQGATMSQRLLGFARHHPYLPENVDIGRVVQGMLPLLNQAVGLGITLDFHTEPNLPQAMVDLHSLERAIMNLVVNARDACGDAGNITITTESCSIGRVPDGASHSPGRYVLVKVHDTGQGIAPEVLGRLFEAYFTTKPPGKGTGLGLSQVYGTIRRANGFIEVESKPGQGACFTLAVPCT